MSGREETRDMSVRFVGIPFVGLSLLAMFCSGGGGSAMREAYSFISLSDRWLIIGC